MIDGSASSVGSRVRAHDERMGTTGCAPVRKQRSVKLKPASDFRLLRSGLLDSIGFGLRVVLFSRVWLPEASAYLERPASLHHRGPARPIPHPADTEPMPERWESLFARAAEYEVDEAAVREALAEVRDE